MSTPEPVDERPAPEIRGGNRPEDYLPYAHEDFELADGAESYPELDDEPLGGNDPDTQ